MYDVGKFQDRPYLVMELLEGQSLKERIAPGPLDARELASIARSLGAFKSIEYSFEEYYPRFEPLFSTVIEAPK